jgi:hypothetical protein
MVAVTDVTIASGIPTVGTGTVATLSKFEKSASSGAPAASDVALAVSLRDANANGQATMTNSAPVVIASNQTAIPTNATTVDPYSQYETVAASSTTQVMGATGATGDYLAGGVVTIFDNATQIGQFVGGGTTPLPSLVPFMIPVGLFSVSGAWKITTGANVTAVGIGRFT